MLRRPSPKLRPS
uniref:Uncharacterized protein n=1 Tax=Salix viminalis TaxID=40686 RepID=A0A6N2KYX9_SALVM